MFHSAARGRVSSSRKHRSNGFFMGRPDGPSIINTTTPPLYQTQDKTALYSIIHLAAAGCSFPRSLSGSAPAWFRFPITHNPIIIPWCSVLHFDLSVIAFHSIPSRQPSMECSSHITGGDDDAGGEGCNSCESGWTMYLASPMHMHGHDDDDDAGGSANQGSSVDDGYGYMISGGGNKKQDYDDDDGDGDSLASDASTGPVKAANKSPSPPPEHKHGKEDDDRGHRGGGGGGKEETKLATSSRKKAAAGNGKLMDKAAAAAAGGGEGNSSRRGHGKGGGGGSSRRSFFLW